MAGMHRESEVSAQFRSSPQPRHLLIALTAACVRELARVKLYCINPKIMRGPDGLFVRVDEKGRADPRLPEPLKSRYQGRPGPIIHEVETALSRDFFSLFWNESRLHGLPGTGETDHLWNRRKFEVHHRPH
jgi:hypothetical protein